MFFPRIPLCRQKRVLIKWNWAVTTRDKVEIQSKLFPSADECRKDMITWLSHYENKYFEFQIKRHSFELD